MSDVIVEHKIPLKGIQCWALKNGLFEDHHKISHFETIFESRDNERLVTIAYHIKDDIPVSLLVFEYYSKKCFINTRKSFYHQGFNFRYGIMGQIGLYVKDKYRGNNYSTELLRSVRNYLREDYYEYDIELLYINAHKSIFKKVEKELGIAVTLLGGSATMFSDDSTLIEKSSKILAEKGYKKSLFTIK